MSSIDPPSAPGSRRSRAPTITIDTSAGLHSDSPAETAIHHTTIDREVKNREPLSVSSSFESRDSRPTSPHNVSSPVPKGVHEGFLAVPGSTSRTRQNAIENCDSFNYEPYPAQSGDALNGIALQLDAGSEKFEITDNSFAFSPGQLDKLINPKSLAAFHAIGGLSGLEKGLRSSPSIDPDVGCASLKGPALFRGTSHDSQRVDKPDSKTSNEQSKILQDGSFSPRKNAPGVQRTFERKPLPVCELMWRAYNDKVLICLTVAATVSLALGLNSSAISGLPNSSKFERAAWVEGASILAISLVIGVGILNEGARERRFIRLMHKKYHSTLLGAVPIFGSTDDERQPQPSRESNRDPDLRKAGHITARPPVIVRMVTGSNTATTCAIAAECDTWTRSTLDVGGLTIGNMSQVLMSRESPRPQVLETPERENRHLRAREIQCFTETDTVISNDSLKRIEVTFFLDEALFCFNDAVIGTVWATIRIAVQLIWVNLIMDTMATLASAMNSLCATDNETKNKSYKTFDLAKWTYSQGFPRHKILQQPKTLSMSHRRLMAMGGLAFLPLVAATSTESSSSNRKTPVPSSTSVTTREVVSTVISIPGGSEDRDSQPWKWREIPQSEEWATLLVPLHNILWAAAIAVFAFVIFRWFCESRSRRIDKTRKYCFFWMVVFQALFFSVRDDPDSPPGFLFGLCIGSGFFTYKSAARGAARFDFGLFYALTGIIIGVVLSFMTLPFIRTESGKPSWETILFPSLAVAFSALEIGSQCFLANMYYRDEDEAHNGSNLPLYKDPHSRPSLGAQTAQFEQTSQWRASQIGMAGGTEQNSVPQRPEHSNILPQNQGISQSVDLPHPDPYLPTDDGSRPVGR